MSEPTLAELIWRSDTYITGPDIVGGDELRAFHARAKALAEGWNTESRNARVQRAILKDYGKQLLAILGDLQP